MANDLFKQLSSMDIFFYYGEGQLTLEDECKADFLELLVQPQGSLFFNRRYGAGVKSFEGYPVGLLLAISLPFNIANSVAIRNMVVSDGSDDFPDRRIAVSQKEIDFSKDDMGNIDLVVPYYLYKDAENPGAPRSISFPTAGIL